MVGATQVGKDLNDPVTQHMRTDFARLAVGQTVGEALDSIRKRPPEGRVIYFYVVDEEGRLKGVVPTRRLLMSPLSRPVGEIMVRDVVTVSHKATVLDACEFFILHRLLAFPVVDDAGKLLGIVDVELYTDELTDLDRREGNDELFQLIGIHLADVQQRTLWGAFVSRFPWLTANITGGLFAAFISGIYEAELARVVALALFIPVVLALAESVAIQSVSLALQTLRGRRPTVASIIDRVRKEAGTGALLGLVCGAAVGLTALVWLGQVGVMVCLLGGIAASVCCAAVIGSTIPNVLHLIDRDPQVAAGPISLALADIFTLLIYFSLARWLFG